MPININNIIFRDKPSTLGQFKQMISLIKKLPSPQVTEYFDREDPIDPKQTILCLQHEMAYLDSYHVSNARYIGSKSVHDCILLYIYTESDHFVLHVDVNSPDELSPSLINIIKTFNDIDMTNKKCPNEINVTLVGGHPCKESEINIINIINALFNVMKELRSNQNEINIIFKSQKIMENNAINETTKLRKGHDILIKKLQIVSQFFNVPLTEKTLKHLSPKSLQNEIDKDIVNKQEVDLDLMFKLLSVMLGNASECYDQNDEASKLKYKTLIQCGQLITLKNESDFSQLVALIFNKEFFYKKLFPVLSPKSDLSDFVFDIQTGNLVTIPENFYSVYEEQRNFSFSTTKIDMGPKTYFLCYDGKTDQHKFPTLNPNVICKFNNFKQRLQSKSCTDLSFMKDICRLEINEEVISHFVRYAKPINNYKYVTGMNRHFFKQSYLNYVQEYYVDKDTVSCQNLYLLKSVNENFVARIRKFPEYTIDALLTCESLTEAQNMRELLESNDVPVRLLHFNDKMVVCVPCINVAKYAQAIKHMDVKNINRNLL